MAYVLPTGVFCCFCESMAQRLPWYPVQQTRHAVAFLNPRQRSRGALLVAPKRHVCVFTDLKDVELQETFEVARSVAGILVDALRPSGVHTWCNSGVAAGQSEAHAHFQVVPRYEGVPYTFASSNEIAVTSREQMVSTAARLRAYCDSPPPPTRIETNSRSDKDLVGFVFESSLAAAGRASTAQGSR